MLLLLLMTIAQLLAAAAENLSQAPSEITVPAYQNQLVRSVNSGLAEFVDGLPDLRRTEPKSARLPAALARTAAITQGGTGLTFDPAWTASEQAPYLGRTVVVAGATGYNRLSAASTLLIPWEGATNAAASISIRSDAVVLGGLEDCIEGEVILALSDRQAVLNYGRPVNDDEADVMRLLEGVPQYWWTEPLNGISAGSAPQYVLRVFPQPDAVYSLLYNRKLWPTAITWAMVASTTEIPVLVREEKHLVALCQEALLTHPLWLGSADKDRVSQAASAARGWLQTVKPNQGHNQPARCRTKKGF